MERHTLYGSEELHGWRWPSKAAALSQRDTEILCGCLNGTVSTPYKAGLNLLLVHDSFRPFKARGEDTFNALNVDYRPPAFNAHLPLHGIKGFVIPTKSFGKIGITKLFCYNNKMFSSINNTFGCDSKIFCCSIKNFICRPYFCCRN